MFEFILMAGEYDDRDPVFISSDLDRFTLVVKNYIRNWYEDGCRYLDTPSGIMVMKEGCLYEHWEPERFDLSGVNSFYKIDKLFERIKDYVKEEK